MITNMININLNEYKKLFIQFLKENNALKEFKTNIIKNYAKAYQNYLNIPIKYKNPFEKQSIIALYIDPIAFAISRHSACFNESIEKSLYHIIDDSFLWGNTPQGYKFWNQLDHKWRQLTKTLK